jgi:hypothetical protein
MENLKSKLVIFVSIVKFSPMRWRHVFPPPCGVVGLVSLAYDRVVDYTPAALNLVSRHFVAKL